MNPEDYNRFMELAIHQAKLASEAGEVPVGALVVHDGKIIGRGYNRIESLHDATAHAEMIALSAAYEQIGDWRLENCQLVCTLEPCPMCAGAAMLSRIETIIFGASDPKFGACGSIIDIPRQQKFNHQIEVVGGISELQVASMMKAFFQNIRKKKRES